MSSDGKNRTATCCRDPFSGSQAVRRNVGFCLGGKWQAKAGKDGKHRSPSKKATFKHCFVQVENVDLIIVPSKRIGRVFFSAMKDFEDEFEPSQHPRLPTSAVRWSQKCIGLFDCLRIPFELAGGSVPIKGFCWPTVDDRSH